MQNLKINFDELRHGSMRQTLDALERSFRKFNIDFYLIGAFARDLWLNHLDILPERRMTNDIDFSIYINDVADYTALKDYLMQHEHFVADRQHYRLYSPDGTTVDLIPFGGIEHNQTVYIEGNPPLDLSVFGNMEVLNHAVRIDDNGTEFKVCTLPGLCVLKLVAGYEKPERAPKDFGDFYYILENYFEIAGDTIFETRYEDLIDENFHPGIAAAKLFGRQLVPILNESTKLRSKIITILGKLREGFSDEEIDQMFLHEPQDHQIKKFKLVASVLAEINNS